MPNRRTIAAIVVLLTFLSSSAQAEDAEWQSYYGCLRQHVADVARIVDSVDEGAALIAEVLCVNEAAAVANAMMRRPDADRGEFSSFLYVVLRETRGLVYRQKLAQPG